MKRNIDGIFLLNKPTGISSNHALQRVKRLFNANKAGHTGSLDPLATGMLPICLGEATKYSQHLLDADKCYEVTAKLGVRTDTGDSEGSIISCRDEWHSLFSSHEQWHELLKKFTGSIQQIPPMHSALKHKGKPLYEYARKGEAIERAARTVTIYELSLLSVEADNLSLRVHCSKGTYIRSLVDDMGEALGCGAHVTALHRVWVEPFQTSSMMSLEVLENAHDRDAYLLPADAALLAWPKRVLNDEEAKRLLQGLPLYVLNMEGYVRFYSQQHIFLGVGQVLSGGEVTNKRLTGYKPRISS